MSYYDDNFGSWEGMDDPDMVEFYNQVQEESVEKTCTDCGRTVRLRPDYVICNTCADKRERGLAY
jgi:hypothetical protein